MDEHIARSFNEYKRVGAMMRLLKDVLTTVKSNTEHMVTSEGKASLALAESEIEKVCTELACEMRNDYPNFPVIYDATVFYGTLNRKPLHSVDSEVIHMAKSVADDLFWKNPKSARSDDTGRGTFHCVAESDDTVYFVWQPEEDEEE